MVDVEQLDRAVAAEKQELLEQQGVMVWEALAETWANEPCHHEKEPATCGWSHCSRCGSEYSCCSFHSNRKLASAHLCGDRIDEAMRAERR